MIYKGSFEDINKKEYVVVIDAGGGDVEAITLGTAPFVTSMSSDSLFAPLKLREATINIVNDKYLFDIYNSSAQGVMVEVSNGDNIVFKGYVTPCAYQQGYADYMETIEIQAVEAISTLQYYEYETFENSFPSFQQIIDKCLDKCNCYQKVIYPKSLRLSSDEDSDLLAQLCISNSNFYQSDEDHTPWKLKSVLEEILKYLGWSLMVHNNVVYLLDYSYINSGRTEYWEHTINGSTSSVTLSDIQTIKNTSHTSNDSKLSLSDTFNKVSVKAVTNEISDIVPDLWDEKNLENIYGYYNAMKEYTPGKDTSIPGDSDYTYFMKWYRNKDYVNITHNPLTLEENGDNLNPDSYEWWKSNIACVISKSACYKNTDDKPSTLSWENVLYCSTGLDIVNKFLDPDWNKFKYNNDVPILKLKKQHNNDICLCNTIDKPSYIVINARMCYNKEDWFPGISHSAAFFESKDMKPTKYSNPKYNGAELSDVWEERITGLNLILRIGDKYWNGKEWTTTKSTFKVCCDEDNVTAYVTSNKWMSIVNNVTFDMGIDKEGFAIPVCNDDNLTGELEFTILRPPFEVLHTCYILIKDLSIEVCIPSDEWTGETKDTDTTYSNIINEDYVNEFSDLELKVNSQSDKEYSYSSVLQNDNGSYKYNSSLYNVVLSHSDLQEHNLIETMYNHFASPKRILQMDLRNTILPYSRIKERNLNLLFCVNKMDVDYEQDSATMELYEF